MNPAPDEFIDADTIVQKSDVQLSLPFIAMKHFDAIAKFNSVEFRGGYWEKTIQVIQGTVYPQERYVSDTRESYCGYVSYLRDVLIPYFDKTMIESEKRIITRLENNYVKYLAAIDEKGKSTETKEVMKENYKTVKLNLWKEMFQEISRLLFRLKYFKMERYIE